jgi:hypothetical protein
MTPTHAWVCECGARVESYGRDTTCSGCYTDYNAFGQRLRAGWSGNPSLYDEDISDLDGYEQQMHL